jgi:hypothetical protein
VGEGVGHDEADGDKLDKTPVSKHPGSQISVRLVTSNVVKDVTLQKLLIASPAKLLVPR